MISRRTFRTLCLSLFLLLFFALVYLQKTAQPRVLVIHSYNTDYNWVPALNEGLARAFDGRRDLELRYHYLDLKNHTDDSFRRTAERLAHRVIEEMQPDIVILFDDVAQRLVGQRYASDNPDARPRLVYGGVNAEADAYYAGAANVTGILERKPLEAIRETLLIIGEAQKITPQEATKDRPLRVQFIGDFSPSITAEIPFYDQIDWAPLVWLPPVQVDSFDAWKAAVDRAGREADILMLTNYQQIRETEAGAFVRPAARVMHWTEANAAIPVLGLGFSNGADGAMLTVSVSPFEQGEVAGQMALALIDGAEVADLDAVLPRQFMVHMCQPTLARRAVEVPVFYEAFARATGHFYETC